MKYPSYLHNHSTWHPSHGVDFLNHLDVLSPFCSFQYFALTSVTFQALRKSERRDFCISTTSAALPSMYSLRPILSTTKASSFPLHISGSVKLGPHFSRRSTIAFPQAVVNARFIRLPSASVRSALSSPSLVDAAVDTDGSTSEESLLWEERIEKGIYRCRFLAFLGVVGSLMGSVLCYLKGCVHVMDSFAEYFSNGGRVILMLVEAMDIYLIGTVMLVFGMGLYELFISNLDVAKTSSHGSSLIGLFKLPERPKWLEIKSVSELKTKVGHAMVLVLLIGLFDKSKKVTICSPKDLLCFAASILLSSGCLYLLSMLQTSS